MIDEPPGSPPGDADVAGYPVPPQFSTPPDAVAGSPLVGSPLVGSPLVASDDPAALPWGPASAAPAEPERWTAPPPHRYGGTTVLDRPTAARRPVVAPPVGPSPPSPSAPGWDWGRGRGVRSAVLGAAAIVLVGLLIAAFVVLRHHGEDNKPVLSDPSPAGKPTDGILDPAVGGGVAATTGPPTIPPVSVLPQAQPTSAAAAPATSAPSATTVPIPTTTPTTKVATSPTVTASPSSTGGPVPTQPTTTVPRTTTSTTRAGSG